ncbi:MAG: ion channel [Acidimicrobiia bacterium]
MDRIIERMSLADHIFDDDNPHLDKFGVVLALAAAAVAMNLLVDSYSPSGALREDVVWIAVTLITGATLVFAARASGVKKRVLRIGQVVVLLSVGAATVVAVTDALGLTDIGVSTQPSWLWTLLSVAAPLVVLRRISTHRKVSDGTILGAISVFLLISLAFTYLQLNMETLGLGAAFGSVEPSTSYMYFSLVTITTTGYGDLVPVTKAARLLATSEAIIGQIFLVTVIARLVSLYRAPERRRWRSSADEPTAEQPADP